jgi:hypothetical protein
MWNWIRDGTPEEVAADRAYSVQMISMLGRHGGGALHLGSPIGRSASPALDGTYDAVAAKLYPRPSSVWYPYLFPMDAGKHPSRASSRATHSRS